MTDGTGRRLRARPWRRRPSCWPGSTGSWPRCRSPTRTRAGAVLRGVEVGPSAVVSGADLHPRPGVVGDCRRSQRPRAAREHPGHRPEPAKCRPTSGGRQIQRQLTGRIGQGFASPPVVVGDQRRRAGRPSLRASARSSTLPAYARHVVVGQPAGQLGPSGQVVGAQPWSAEFANATRSSTSGGDAVTRPPSPRRHQHTH